MLQWCKQGSIQANKKYIKKYHKKPKVVLRPRLPAGCPGCLAVAKRDAKCISKPLKTKLRCTLESLIAVGVCLLI